MLGTAARVGLGTLAGSLDASAAAIGTDNAIDDVTPFNDPALIATLAANLLGSLGLGVAVGAHWPARLEWLRAGVGTGFFGAFTTFSFVALVFAVLGFSSSWGWGLLVLGLIGGLLFAAVGTRIGHWVRPKHDAEGASA